MMSNGFVRGMAVGILAGAAIGMAVVPKKRCRRTSMRKVLKSAGEIVGGISDAILG